MPYQEPMFLPWDGRRVPLTFVGGYLGAGKTTAINEVLRVSDRPVAVVVNDVGAVNVDARLIRSRKGDMIELTDGCICCTSIEGMGAAFDQIRARPEPPDHVIVELSGVADPERMLPWGRSAGFVLDGLVVVVAADQLTGDELPAFVRGQLEGQVAAADLLVLTKTDLIGDAAVAEARQALTRLAPGTPVLDGGRTLGPGVVGRFLALGGRRPGGFEDIAAATLFDAHETHTVAVPFGLSRADLDVWLDDALVDIESAAGQVVRAKAIVDTPDEGPVVVQVVGRRREIDPLPVAEHRPSTDLVVITLRPT
jgi:G3E family GTPase